MEGERKLLVLVTVYICLTTDPCTAAHSKFQRNVDRAPHAPVYPYVPV